MNGKELFASEQQSKKVGKKWMYKERIPKFKHSKNNVQRLFGFDWTKNRRVTINIEYRKLSQRKQPNEMRGMENKT